MHFHLHHHKQDVTEIPTETADGGEETEYAPVPSLDADFGPEDYEGYVPPKADTNRPPVASKYAPPSSIPGFGPEDYERYVPPKADANRPPVASSYAPPSSTPGFGPGDFEGYVPPKADANRLPVTSSYAPPSSTLDFGPEDYEGYVPPKAHTNRPPVASSYAPPSSTPDFGPEDFEGYVPPQVNANRPPADYERPALASNSDPVRVEQGGRSHPLPSRPTGHPGYRPELENTYDKSEESFVDASTYRRSPPPRQPYTEYGNDTGNSDYNDFVMPEPHAFQRAGNETFSNYDASPSYGNARPNFSGIARMASVHHGETDPALYEEVAHRLHRIPHEHHIQQGHSNERAHAAYTQAYGDESYDTMDSDAIGAAAAMQALKLTAAQSRPESGSEFSPREETESPPSVPPKHTYHNPSSAASVPQGASAPNVPAEYHPRFGPPPGPPPPAQYQTPHEPSGPINASIVPAEHRAQFAPPPGSPPPAQPQALSRPSGPTEEHTPAQHQAHQEPSGPTNVPNVPTEHHAQSGPPHGPPPAQPQAPPKTSGPTERHTPSTGPPPSAQPQGPQEPSGPTEGHAHPTKPSPSPVPPSTKPEAPPTSSSPEDKLIALAMGQAAKLFDKKSGGSPAQGSAASDAKKQAMQSAAQTAMRMANQYRSTGKVNLQPGEMQSLITTAMSLI